MAIKQAKIEKELREYVRQLLREQRRLENILDKDPVTFNTKTDRALMRVERQMERLENIVAKLAPDDCSYCS